LSASAAATKLSFFATPALPIQVPEVKKDDPVTVVTDGKQEDKKEEPPQQGSILQNSILAQKKLFG
jgi:hypothetical protein